MEETSPEKEELKEEQQTIIEEAATQVELDKPGLKVDKANQSIEQRTKELNESLRRVSRIFSVYGKELKERLGAWITASVVLLIAIIVFYIYLFQFQYPEKWDWQFGFKTVIRLSAITGLFSLFAFCIKMVRSYLYMFEHNMHKRSIVGSMSSFVGSAIGRENRDVVYSKMIDIVVEMGNTGLINNESDFKQQNVALETLERLLEKEKKK